MMKKIILSIVILLTLNQNIKAQKTYAVTGTVFSAISQVPLGDQTIRISVTNNDSIKRTFLDENGRFEIKGLEKGLYKLFLETSNDAGDYFFKNFDTLIVLGKTPILDITIIKQCPNCDCWEKWNNEANRERAFRDIKKGDLGLFVPGVGIDGTLLPQPNDDNFQKKYKIRYRYHGCTSPDLECMEGYNAVIIEYLDEKFGKQWREEARTDVIYLRKRLKID